MVNPKENVVIGEMEHLLRIWLDDQAQRRIPGSQEIISAKAKNLKCYTSSVSSVD
jgi:hypothetical protein